MCTAFLVLGIGVGGALIGVVRSEDRGQKEHLNRKVRFSTDDVDMDMDGYEGKDLVRHGKTALY